MAHMTFRVDPELREAATRIAKARGESVSNDVLRPAMAAYVEQNEGTEFERAVRDRLRAGLPDVPVHIGIPRVFEHGKDADNAN